MSDEEIAVLEDAVARGDLDAAHELEFDCTTCPLRTRREELPSDAMLALRIHNLLTKRVIHDLHLQPLVFDALGLTFRASERSVILDLIELLDTVHTARCPLPEGDVTTPRTYPAPPPE